ncbi:PP0621 family protein [Azovibrio sp.]|uniref:PP0621 family protein n=1 Tax=Azovibrio sp. TaxID=1872673 RepID=UPI003C78F52C
MKYLLLIVLCVGLWWYLRQWKRKAESRGRVEYQAPAETMAACAHCGVYVPLGEMVTDDEGLRFCCAAHRALGPVSGRQK